jgi:hypothetical protein
MRLFPYKTVKVRMHFIVQRQLRSVQLTQRKEIMTSSPFKVTTGPGFMKARNTWYSVTTNIGNIAIRGIIITITFPLLILTSVYRHSSTPPLRDLNLKRNIPYILLTKIASLALQEIYVWPKCLAKQKKKNFVLIFS